MNRALIIYKNKLYKLDEISVIGLVIGARGTVTQLYEEFRNQFGLDSILSYNIIVLTIKNSY